MSVTFWFHGDEQITEVFPCQCAEFSDNGLPDPNCHYCGGEGEITTKSGKHDANFSNANAARLLRLAGFPDDAYLGGEMKAGEMKDRMGRVISLCLFGPEDVRRRAHAITCLCLEAGDDTMVHWA